MPRAPHSIIGNNIKRHLLHLVLLGAGFLLALTFRVEATTYYVNVANPSPATPFTNWLTASTDIQSAIDAATDGDLILVTNGIYNTGGRVVYGTLTNRVVINKAVTVQSVNGPAGTMIVGYQIPSVSTAYSNNVRCIYMTNNAALNGFTITNGATLANSSIANQTFGGGVYCESTNATITNCFLVGNLVTASGGAGVYEGTLFSCVLSNNMIPDYGPIGGAANQSVLNNCLIISNAADFGGGAALSILNHCSVIGNYTPVGSVPSGGGTYVCTANYCLIADNLSVGVGGGNCGGNLNFCVLSNNLAKPPAAGITCSGGGSFGGALYNCLLVSNYCFGNGGAYFQGGAGNILTNCTIVGNNASNGVGGVVSAVLKNCIAYGNYGIHSGVVFEADFLSSTLYYCWTNNPIYVNPAGGDYHLSSSSPCINSGNNTYVSGMNDLDGNPRIVGGTVDIGAYEYQTPSSVLSYAWAQQYGLPTDGSADYLDSDGDGMNNWQEWIAGTNPTNAASVLKLSSPSNSISGVKVTWQSVANVTYYLQRSTNLAALPAFTSIVSNLLGQVGSTSYTDATATATSSYFYRVGVQ